jgi:hypothetical protein
MASADSDNSNHSATRAVFANGLGFGGAMQFATIFFFSFYNKIKLD